MGVLPVQKEVLLDDLKHAKKIVCKWIDLIEKGIPMEDVPAPSENLEAFVREFVGEMTLVSNKTESLAEIVSSTTG